LIGRIVPENATGLVRSSASRDRSNRLIAGAAVALSAIALTLQLLIPPIVGLANEGDFERVMGYAGFQYLTQERSEKFYEHIVTRFAIISPGWYSSGYLTSEIPLAYSARLASELIRPRRLFDIRILGAVHSVILMLAIWILLRACRCLHPLAQGLLAALLFVVYTDVGYAAAFNSFFAQTASFLFLLLTVAVSVEGNRRGALEGSLLIPFFLSAALFVSSKPQEAIHGPLLALWGLWLSGFRPARGWRQPAIWFALGLCLFALWYYRQTPKAGIRNVGLFHTVFHELLQNSPDPQRDIDELGLDRDMARYIGMHAYMPQAPMTDPTFQARFFDRFGYGKVVAFYLRHPARLLDRLRRAAPAAFRLRPKYLGNFEKTTGVPPRTKATRFALWSDLRAKLESRAVLWLLLFFGGNLAAVAIAWVRASCQTRIFLAGILVCLLLASLEFVVCALADSLDDLGRHLFVFDALFDLVLIADVAWMAQAVSRHIFARRLAATAPA
jgi:hypothetical protein